MIGFLLGSGFSCPAGMPSVDKITKDILDLSRPVARNQEGRYCFNPPSFGDGNYWVKECRALLALLMREGDAFFKKNNSRETNYEDLYYTILQLEENQAISVRCLRKMINKHYEHRTRRHNKHVKIKKIISEAKHLIFDIVWKKLDINDSSLQVEDFNYLKSIHSDL